MNKSATIGGVRIAARADPGLGRTEAEQVLRKLAMQAQADVTDAPVTICSHCGKPIDADETPGREPAAQASTGRIGPFDPGHPAARLSLKSRPILFLSSKQRSLCGLKDNQQ